MSPSPMTHEEARRHLAAFAMGLVEGAEEQRLQAHVDSCETCRRSIAQLQAGVPQSAAHLPPALIRNWPKSRAELRGLERALVRRHLERCDACRQDLQLFGHGPELEHIPALEPSPDLLERLERVGTMEREPSSPSTEDPEATQKQVVIRLVPGERFRVRSFLDQLTSYGGWAAAAALLVVLAGPWLRDSRHPSGPSLPGSEHPVTPAPKPPGTGETPGAVIPDRPPAGAPIEPSSEYVLGSVSNSDQTEVMRGDAQSTGASIPVITIGADARFVSVPAPIQSLPPSGSGTFQMKCLDPAGRICGSLTTTIEKIAENPRLVLGRPGRALDVGRYTIVVSMLPDSAGQAPIEHARSAFELRR